jgi:hypothetical protein
VAAKPLEPKVADAILVDWRVLQLTQRDIAKKNKVSVGSVNRLCKGVTRDMISIVNAQVQVNQALTGQGERILTAVHNAVDEQMRYQKFFRGANMLVANTVASKVKEQGKAASFQDLNAAASALGRAQESVLGKAPDMVINNHQAVQVVVAHSPQELRRLNQELEDAC